MKPCASVFVLTAILALLTACAARSRIEPLSVTLADIRPGQILLLEQEYLIKIRVQNATNADIPVIGLSYRIDLNGKPFAKGVSKQDVLVPAFGEVVLNATAVSSLSGIINQFVQLHTQLQHGVPDKVSYRLTGQIASASSTYPFDAVDNIALPGLN